MYTGWAGDENPSGLPSIVETITPSEDFVEGTAACINNPNSYECKQWNNQLLTETAIVGTSLALLPAAGAITTAGGLSTVATSAYVKAAVALASSPVATQRLTNLVTSNAGDIAAMAICALTQDPSFCTASDLASISMAVGGISVGTSFVLEKPSINSVKASKRSLSEMNQEIIPPPLQKNVNDLVENLAKKYGQPKKPYESVEDVVKRTGITKKDKYSFMNIEKVLSAYKEYGSYIRNKGKEGDVDSLMKLADKLGYKPQLVTLNSEEVVVREAKGWVKMPLTTENSVRIGPKNELYIGVSSAGTVNIADLCHDLGACVMGGKVQKYSAYITLEALQLTNAKSQGGITSNSDIRKFIGTRRIGSEELIPNTWLFDALVTGGYESRNIKYLP